jgi:para-nitrobenzyl esterase
MRLDRRALLAAGLALLPPALPGRRRSGGECAAGRYRGLAEGGVQVFRGIRYGRSTVQRRFQAPLAPAPLRDILPAQQFAGSCPQAGERDLIQDEDCCSSTSGPRRQPRAKRPVAVYFHGGAYRAAP